MPGRATCASRSVAATSSWSSRPLTVADLLLVLAALPLLVATGYLCALALLARRAAPPAERVPFTRFAVVVPAHDEEAGIAATVASLLGVRYPRDRFRVVVVADNCTDGTAARAAAAGAAVLERHDTERRGKGYALAHAFERVLSEGWADAVVVVDADTLVSPNLLAAFDQRFQAGALALQAEYGVRNAEASWRTRLMALALALFHGVRSLARERLLLSCGLRGNGMAFSARVLRDVPHRAFSIVEDAEYGIALGLAGHRVVYVAEARVWGDMAATERTSRSQRQRWEGGRRDLVRRVVPELLRRGWRERRALLLDLAADLLVPPLATLVLAATLGSAVAAAAAVTGAARAGALAWIAVDAALLVYVARGWVESRLGLAGLRDLLWAPVYVAWKLSLAFRGRSQEWVRTTREGGA